MRTSKRAIKKYDVFVILESWLDHEDPCHPIKKDINFKSERKKSKAKRNFGGIYCRKALFNAFHKIKTSSQDILLLQLDRAFFALPNDLYICVACLAIRDVTNQWYGMWKHERMIYLLPMCLSNFKAMR